MELVIAYLAVNIVAGLVACLFGRRLFYAVLGVLVFLGVFNVALASTDGAPLSLAIAAALGVAAALLSRRAYRAGVFLVGFAAGAALGFVVTMLLPAEASSFLGAIMLVAGLLLGLAAVRWSDLAVRVGTAWTGATFVVPNAVAAALALPELVALAAPGDPTATFEALSAYIAGDLSAAHGTAILAGTVVLAVVGVVVQARQKG